MPGVTTVLKQLAKPGIVQWAVDNTAAYAVANIDGLLSRTEEQGYGFLRWYWKRDPLKGDLTDIRNYSNGVLDDSAELGTLVHDWIAAEHDACPYPNTEGAGDFFWEMVEQWDAFAAAHDITPLHSEVTLWNKELGYAGTADGIWAINGEVVLIDLKTSRNTWDEHWMQLIALRECDTMLVETSEGEWLELEAPKYNKLALVHIRPSDTDKNGNPMLPFATMKVMPEAEYDVMFTAFKGLLSVTHALSDIKNLRK